MFFAASILRSVEIAWWSMREIDAATAQFLMIVVMFLVVMAELERMNHSLNRKLDQINRKLDQITEFLPGKMVDFWCPGMDRLIGVATDRLEDQREKLAIHCGCLKINDEGAELAKCCVTGIMGTGKGTGTKNAWGAVVVSHKLGRKRPAAVVEMFDLDIYKHVDDQRNMILVLKSIEQLYKQKKLCFVPSQANLDGGNASEFQILIMDPKIRGMPVFSYESNAAPEPQPLPFSHYESKPFSFPKGKVPYTRILSHHAAVSHAHAVSKGWVHPTTVPPPKEFGDPLKHDTLALRVPLVITSSKRKLVQSSSSSVSHCHGTDESTHPITSAGSNQESLSNPTSLESQFDNKSS